MECVGLAVLLLLGLLLTGAVVAATAFEARRLADVLGSRLARLEARVEACEGLVAARTEAAAGDRLTPRSSALPVSARAPQPEAVPAREAPHAEPDLPPALLLRPVPLPAAAPELARVPDAPAASGALPVPPARIIEADKPAASAPAAAPARRDVGWETRIGGQWLAWFAAVTAVIGVGLFLKWAYDMGWITPLFHLPPLAYLGLGWATGAAFWATGERLRLRLPAYAQGVAGAGVAILYLTTYAGYGLYRVLDFATAGAGLTLLGGLAVFTALRHNSPAVGWLGVALAYLSPVLLGGRGSPHGLFLYLTALNAGVLGISVARRWSAFRTGAFAATALLYGTWHLRHYNLMYLEETLAFLAVNSVVFLGVLALRPLLRAEETGEADLLVAVLNPFLSGLVCAAILHDRHAGLLAGIALAAAAIYYGVARALRARRGTPDYLEQLCFATALVLALLAAPAGFGSSSRLLGASWALAGAALIACGAGADSRRTTMWGGVALALSLGRLLSWDVWIASAPAGAGVFASRAFSFAALLLGLGAAAAAAAGRRERSPAAGSWLTGIGAVMVALLDLWTVFDGQRSWHGGGWSAAAALALAFGWQLRSGGLRAVGHAAALLPLFAAAHILPRTEPGWWAALLLAVGAAACLHRAAAERVPERWLSPFYAAAAVLLLDFRAAGVLPPVLQPAAWASAAALAFGAGIRTGCSGYRLVGAIAATGTVVSLLPFASTGLGATALDRSPAFAAVLAVCIGGAVWSQCRAEEWERSLLPPLLATGAAVSAMVWSGLELDRGWLPVAWLGVAALLLRTGVITDRAVLRVLGFVAAAAMTVEALTREMGPLTGGLVFFHPRMAAAAAVLAAWIASAWTFYRHGTADERAAAPLVAALANLQALGWLSLEAMDAGARLGPTAWAREASQFALSAVWMGYAACAILVGFRRQLSAVRWGGLGLLLAAVAKVYLYDLGFLALGYRVLSFLVLAVVLLGISYQYQRRASGEADAQQRLQLGQDEV